MSFYKIGRKCPNLEKKCPDCGHLWVKFPVSNEIFENFPAKKQRLFPCGAFLSHVVGECSSKSSNSKKTPLP